MGQPTTKCKSCDAPVVWAKNSKGTFIIMDAKPEKRIVIDQVNGEALCKMVDTYISHFATCPDHKKWRKGAKETKPPANRTATGPAYS